MSKFTTEINLCTCNNCAGIFIDKNPQINATLYLVDETKVKELQYGAKNYWYCPSCNTDDYLSDEVNEQEAMARGIIDTY